MWYRRYRVLDGKSQWNPDGDWKAVIDTHGNPQKLKKLVTTS